MPRHFHSAVCLCTCVFVYLCVCVSVDLLSTVNNELVPLPMARWRICTAVAAVWELPNITAHINQCGAPPHRPRATSKLQPHKLLMHNKQ